MRLMGFALLISGMAIVLVALVLLTSLAQRVGFVLTGVAVEALGLIVLALGYKSLQTIARRGPGR